MFSPEHLKNIDSVMRDINSAGFGGCCVVVTMNMHDSSLYAQMYSAYERVPTHATFFGDDRRVGVFTEPILRETLVSLCADVYSHFWND